MRGKCAKCKRIARVYECGECGKGFCYSHINYHQCYRNFGWF